MLRARLGRTPAAPDVAAGAPTPEGGWVEVRDGEVVLREVPPVAATVPVALATALLAPSASPSDELLRWFGEHRTAPIAWTPDDTPLLVDVLRADEPRAWRFLDVSGVLERALPEVARAMDRRRADMTDLDPLGSLRFVTVDRLHNSVAEHAPEFSLGRRPNTSPSPRSCPTSARPASTSSSSPHASPPTSRHNGSCPSSRTPGCCTDGRTT